MEMNPLTKCSDLNTVTLDSSQLLTAPLTADAGRKWNLVLAEGHRHTHVLLGNLGVSSRPRIFSSDGQQDVGFRESSPGPSLIFCFQKMLIDLEQVATPLGLGFIVHRLNTGSKETGTAHRATGREQGVTALHTKPWTQWDFRTRIFEVLGRCYSYFLTHLFIYFWLCWVLVAGLSLVAARGGYSSLQCMGFSLQWLLLWQRTGSRALRLSSCGSRA